MRKHIIVLVLALVCVLGLGGCKSDGASVKKKSFDVKISYTNRTDKSEINLGALNADLMTIDGTYHPPIYKFDTLEDLERFKLDFGGILDMDISYDKFPSFENTTNSYDEAFFEENTLMLVYVRSNSSSYRYGVNDIFCDGSSFCVHLKYANSPEVVTDDTAGWFITIAAPDSMAANCTKFDADFNIAV